LLYANASDLDANNVVFTQTYCFVSLAAKTQYKLNILRYLSMCLIIHLLICSKNVNIIYIHYIFYLV